MRDNITELLDLKIGKTKLVVAVSKYILLKVQAIMTLQKYIKEKIKSCYCNLIPAIAEDHLKNIKNIIIETIIRKSYTENRIPDEKIIFKSNLETFLAYNTFWRKK